LNGVLEKLLENWLDSASEKSYQTSFVQMLAAQGYCVLHSTRHCALEYGKDVIAIAPDSVPCAFQLKGNPGGRLGLSEFRADLQQQLIQLMSQPIIFPSIPEGLAHRSFLVSNGYFDEEVHRAVDDLNRGPYLSKLSLISRGQLIAWANDLGCSLWPSEMTNIHELLEIFLHDGHDLLPAKRLSLILEELFALRLSDTPLKAAQLERAMSSAALLIGVATHHFSMEDNHFAVASAWCMFVVSAISAYQRSSLKMNIKSEGVLLLAEQTIKDSLVALWNEMQIRGSLIGENALAEPEVYKWRYTLLCGIFSTLWFFPELTSDDKERKSSIAEWLNRHHENLFLWGEAAIPCFLALQLFLRSTGMPERSNKELIHLFQSVLTLNQIGNEYALPDPYYLFEDVGRALYGLKASSESSALKEETFAGSAYSAELLLQLMVRYNLKQPCQEAWPYFNRLCHKRFIPAQPWQYGLLKSTEGIEETRQYPPEYTWKNLCEESSIETCEYLPEGLSTRPHLLLLWLIIAPHRLTSDVGRVLDANVKLTVNGVKKV
jgi:hypothetical protein